MDFLCWQRRYRSSCCHGLVRGKDHGLVGANVQGTCRGLGLQKSDRHGGYKCFKCVKQNLESRQDGIDELSSYAFFSALILFSSILRYRNFLLFNFPSF